MGKRGKTGEHNNHPSRERSNFWKGGATIDNGYRYIYSPGNKMSNKNGYIPEHRLVMSKHLKRNILKNEIVHHKNGYKLDNRIENLEIRSRKSHIYDHLPIQFTKRFKGFVPKVSCKFCGIIFKPPRMPRCKNTFCSKKHFFKFIRSS